MGARTVACVAHAYGNRRHRVERALAAGVEYIEADLRWTTGQVWVRHERRLSRLPLLYNLRLRGVHREGPYAVPVGPLWLRLDVRRIRFEQLVEQVSGRAGLVLDLKTAEYRVPAARAFVSAIFGTLERMRFAGPLDFCGDWRLLDLVRKHHPDQPVHYSVDHLTGWQRLEERIQAGRRVPSAITLKRSLVTPERVERLASLGIGFMAWDVGNDEDARHCIALGAEGLIADDLELLARYRGVPVGAAGVA